MKTWNTSLPKALAELHELDFAYLDGQGMDFEPYTQFLDGDETADWFKAWTGNPNVDGSQFRIFGQDGTGGYAAFWLYHDATPILDQPIVFLGSEGERGVVASNFEEYLWLLACGVGPYEAVECSGENSEPNLLFARFAKDHTSGPKLQLSDVRSNVQKAHSNFGDWIESLCR